MTSSMESKNFRIERLLRDSQLENIQKRENKKADGNSASKEIGQKRKSTTMDNGIQTKRQEIKQSKTNCTANAKPQSASSTPSTTVSTAPIPPKMMVSSMFLPLASIVQHQPFPRFLSPPFSFFPPFFSTPPIQGASHQHFPSPAILNPHLTTAIRQQQQIAQQHLQAAFLQQMFIMTPISSLSTVGTSSNVCSNGGNNSSTGESLGRGNGGGNGNPGMAFRIGLPQNGQMNLAANAIKNRLNLIGNGNGEMVAAILATPKNVHQRGKRPTKVGENKGKNVLKKVACNICGKAVSRNYLKRHLRIHSGIKEFKCNWPECGRSFPDQSNWRVHERTHGTEKPFACPTCIKSFKLKSYLTKHAKVCCPGPK